MKKGYLILMLVLLASNFAWAGGYQVGLHGQRNAGMGLIGTSLNNDASAAFYNPGALAAIPFQYSFLGGASAIRGITHYHMAKPSIYQATTDNPLGTPFYLYASARVLENLSAGLAVNTPYGNSLAWEEGWVGRFLIQEITMRAITIQPTLSYRITPALSVGAGFVIANGSVDLTRKLPVQDDSSEGELNINGSTTNYGFNAGILFVPIDGLNIGLSYRSRIQMELTDARADFSVPMSLESNFPAENRVSTSLPLPSNLDLGLSYHGSENLLLGMSLNYVFWSQYESLDFDFAQNTPALPDSENPRAYSDKLIIRLGAEYKVAENFLVRAGTYYDPSPVNENYFSPETPSLNNLALTTGLSFMPFTDFSIDLSFVYIMGMEKDVRYEPENFGGTYKSRVYIPGIGISYQF